MLSASNEKSFRMGDILVFSDLFNVLCYAVVRISAKLTGLAIARSARSTGLDQRRARLVLGWVTVFGRANHRGM